MRSDYRCDIHFTALVESLSASNRKTEVWERCLYRMSVWFSMGEDGSPQYNIRDQIDLVFAKNDPAAERRAVEARRLAGR
jgi:hypothetical protein